MNRQKAEELLIENRYELYKIAYAFLRNESDAMDAVQETIIKVLSNIAKLRNDEAYLFWVKQILINECRRLLSKRRKVIYIDDKLLDSQEKEIYEKELNISLIEAIDKLTDKEREVILLYYMEDMDIKTVAAFLKCPEGTVKSRMSSAKSRLRKILGEGGEGLYEHGR